VEKTTLGDLGVLAGLKAKLDNDEAAKPAEGESESPASE
jgi:hypothetical protein